MKNFLLSIFVFAIILSFCPIYSEDSTDKIAPNKEFYNKIDEFIKDEIKDSNADSEKGRYNFTIALSTSHVTSDQKNAVAMRQAATLIANNICTAGDSISSVCWELDVWEKSPTFTLSEDGAERKQFITYLPQTHKDGSKGGHDTFKTLITILQNIEKPESSIIVLITNSHESRGPVGEKYSVTGRDNKELKSLLEEKGFKAPKEESFDFFFENNDKPITVYLTIVMPKELKSINGNTENRYPSFAYSSWVPEENKPSLEVLPERVKEEITETTPSPEVTQTETPTPVETPIQENQKGGIPIVPIVGAVLLIGIIVAIITKKKNSEDKKINTHELKFTFDNKKFEQKIEEEQIYEMIFCDNDFKMRPKKDENEEEREEDEEEMQQEATIVFEVSYIATSDYFNFKFIKSSVTTDEFEYFEPLGDNKYRIKKGFLDSCEVNFENKKYDLEIN